MASPIPPERSNPESNGQDGGRMSFFDHLNELRKRIIYSAMAVAAGAVVGLSVSKSVMGVIAKPMLDALRAVHMEERLIYTSPTGAINIIIKLGLYIGFVVASPVVLYQVWLFIAPGLYKHERKAATLFLVSSLSLFLTGIAFCYFILLPYTLRFLIGFNVPYFTPLISINEYWDLVLILMLGMGLVFQTPILIFFLALFGLVTPGFLWKNFRYAVLIISVVAAIVTPTPDALTMLVFMAPMVGLYLLGIAVAAVVVYRKRRRNESVARQGAA
jgi:sec-independent protein translocase protein TatC